MAEYSATLLLLLSLLIMVVFQSMVAIVAHRKQQEYIPGIVDDKLDHHSFVFRSHRTFQNSLENVPLFILTAMVGMGLGVSAISLMWSVGVFFIARFIHMVLFYAIATNSNPSPRSYFFIIGLLAQLYLFGVILATEL